MATGYVYDPIFLQHAAPGHLESPDRLLAIVDELERSGLKARLRALPSRAATTAELVRVHPLDYVASIQRLSAEGGATWHGGETFVNEHTYDAAVCAAGSCAAAVEAVWRGEVNNALALVRPPGHHAWQDHGEGFCLFNNVAVAARAAQALGAQRVLIVDFDLHHGQGTQYVFETDPSVLYFSTHQWGIYPGTGHYRETGRGPGSGFTVNVPLVAGAGDSVFARVYDEVLGPVSARFQPDFVLASAGYDAHWTDPLGALLVTLDGLGHVSRVLLDVAQAHCGGKLVFCLEGGYSLPALAGGVANTARVLLGDETLVDPVGPPRRAEHPEAYDELISTVKRVHGLV